MIYPPRLSKIDQDDISSKIKQDGARWSYKILQEWPRPLFGKMEQDDLVRYCKIDQDGHSSFQD